MVSVEHVITILRDHGRSFGWELSVFETARAGDATRAASAEDADLLIAAGGDGTVNEVICGMNPDRAALAVIPLGTANVLAKELRIPRSPADACRVALAGKTKALDLGVARIGPAAAPRRFTCMLGIGFDAQVARIYKDVRAGNYTSYLRPMCESMSAFKFSPVTVRIEQDEFDVTSVVICNTRRYGGPFTIAAGARHDDGLLDVCLVNARSKADICKCLAMAVVGRMHALSFVDVIKARRISVTSATDVPIQLDGDSVGCTPVEVNVLERALRVVVPD